MKASELPAHSPVGPSSGDRWLDRENPLTGEREGCPGSRARCENEPDTQSVYAAEGTAAHWITELCRINEVTADHYLGYSDKNMPHPHGGFFTCDQEMVDGVQVFLDYVNSLPSDMAFFEIKVTYTDWVPYGFGTADDIRVQVKNGYVYVTDFKYGEGIQVYAANNIQLKFYALGVYELLKHIIDIKNFRLVVVQPRLDFIDEWEISLEDLLQWAEEVVRPGAILTYSEDAPIRPGAWCQWCNIKNRCVDRAIYILEGIQKSSYKLTNDEVAALLPLTAGAKKWGTELEEFAIKEIMSGAPVGDYKMVEGRSSRKWINEKELVTELTEVHFYREEEVYTKKLIGITAAEKLFGRKHPVFDKFTHKPQGSPVLVPGHDKREPFNLSSDKEFDEFEDVDTSEFDEFDSA